MGNRQTPNCFLENRQNENFCLTSKLNRDPLQKKKKLYRFERPPLGKSKILPKLSENPQSDDLSLGFDMRAEKLLK